MKKIDTLIRDIHEIIQDDNHKIKPENMKLFLDHVEREISRSLEESSIREPQLRMSILGRPDRQLWYEFHYGRKEKVSPENRMRFAYGHFLEAFILMLAREAGHTVECEQEALDIDGVPGHLDAVIDGEVVDIKSTSPWAYKKFADVTLREQDSFGYIPQLSAYAVAKGKERGYFLAVNKSTAEMTMLEIGKHGLINPKRRIEHLREVLSQSQPPITKCYLPVPDKIQPLNKLLHRECHYCPFKEECWKDANDGHGLRKFQYATGVRYLTEVGKKPRVAELT